MKISHEELAKLCEGHKVRRIGNVKAKRMVTGYENRARAKVLYFKEGPCKYAKNAYRADTKRAGACSRKLFGWSQVVPTAAPSRDY